MTTPAHCARVLLVIATLCSLVGCSQGVTPIDPREPGLPADTRKWLAAAQDGVMAARARHDAAQAELSMIRDWADRTDDVELGDQADERLEGLADARVALAEVNLEIAEHQVTFAEAKLDLIYAERSVHHDLGSYDLQPLRETVDAVRQAVAELVREREEARQEVLRSVGAWWGAYAAYAEGGGDTRSYWIGDREPITEVVETSDDDSNDDDSDDDDSNDDDSDDDDSDD